MRINKPLVFGLTLFSQCCYAALEGYEFRNTQNETVQYTATKDLLNPSNGNLTINVSAGLDRKLKTSVINSSGVSVFENTTGVVTVNDRIEFLNKSFYGKQVAISDIAVNAPYTLKLEYISLNNEVVGTENYSFTIDNEAATHGAIFAEGHGHYQIIAGNAAEWHLGTGGSGVLYIKLPEIEDTSGIKSATIKTYLEDGSLYKSYGMQYDLTNKTAFFDYKANTGMVPVNNLDRKFSLDITLEDNAGNISVTPKQVFFYDTYSGAPGEPFAVFNENITTEIVAGITNYEPYRAGIISNYNPIKLLYRVPLTNYSEIRKGGLNLTNGLGEKTELHRDSEYAYLQITLPFGNNDGNYVRWVDCCRWSAGGIGYNIQLSEQAAKTPRLTEFKYFITETNSWINAGPWTLVQRDQLPWTVSQVRLGAEARPYDQLASHEGTTCSIPAGDTFCIAELNKPLAVGTAGYLHGVYNLASVGIAERELQAPPTWANVAWNDLHKPEITSLVYNEQAKKVQVMVTQPGAGSYFDQLRVREGRLLYSGGYLRPSKTVRNGQYYEFEFDLKPIPEGKHTLTALIIENFGNEVSEFVAEYVSDKQPPIIEILNNNQNSFDEIIGISGIRIKITDMSKYAFESVVLSGGPANDRVVMATLAQEEHIYSLEYPKIFPSLEIGDTYTLTVNVIDEYENKASKSVSFTYRPPNMMELGKVNVLAVNRNLLNRNDVPVSWIRTDELRTNDGHIASGPQNVSFTLRSDAGSAVKIEDRIVQPGDTIDFQVIPVEGRIEVSVYPAEKGMLGTSHFMFDIPQITTDIKSAR